MGFDLYGTRLEGRAVNYDSPAKGEYFRASVWTWAPLWDLTCHIASDILTDEDMSAGRYNGGHFIDAKKSVAIAARFTSMITSGEHDTLVNTHNASLDALPLEECRHCSGTGERNDEYCKGQCNAFDGFGASSSVETFYLMYSDMITEF